MATEEEFEDFELGVQDMMVVPTPTATATATATGDVNEPSVLEILEKAEKKQTKAADVNVTMYRYRIDGSFQGCNFENLHVGSWCSRVQDVIGAGNRWVDDQHFNWLADFMKVAIVVRLEIRRIPIDNNM